MDRDAFAPNRPIALVAKHDAQDRISDERVNDRHARAGSAIAITPQAIAAARINRSDR